MLTIKILSTINSLKKTIPSMQYLQFLSFNKNPLVLIRKNSFNKKKIIRIKNISFQLKQPILIIIIIIITIIIIIMSHKQLQKTRMS